MSLTSAQINDIFNGSNSIYQCGCTERYGYSATRLSCGDIDSRRHENEKDTLNVIKVSKHCLIFCI